MTGPDSCWMRIVSSVSRSPTSRRRKRSREELEQLAVEVGPVGARGLGRLDDPPRVVLVDGRGLRPHVGAMDREARERVAQGLVQLVARVVAVPATPLADLEEERGEPVQVTAHRL